MNPPPPHTAEDGWQASLRLQFEKRGNKTVLADNTHSGPLRVQMPLYPEGDVCQTCILHPPGGVVGGDRLSIDLAVQRDAHALVTTPGATKFYRSGGRLSVQQQHLRVSGGMLEWFPQDNIVFPGADVQIGTNIQLSDGAVFIGWEVLCLGLPTRSEEFKSGTLQSSIKLFIDNRPIFIDRLQVETGKDLKSPTGLRGFPVSGTMLATGLTRTQTDDLRTLLPENSTQYLVGLSLQNKVLICRYLGRSTFEARKFFQNIWTGLRPLLADRDACPPRIWST